MNQQLFLKKAECLNDIFVRQTRIDVDDNTSGPFDDVQDANNIHRTDEIRLNDIGVKYVLLSLDHVKATGPGGISKTILRLSASEFASPLCDLFNASLSSSTVPFSWKQANVCAVHKKDNKSCANNYRPISVWKRYFWWPPWIYADCHLGNKAEFVSGPYYITNHQKLIGKNIFMSNRLP